MRNPASGPVRRVPAVAAALLLLLLCPPLLCAGDETSVEERLNQAKDLEKIKREPEAALEIYEALASDPELSAELKGDVLAGAARCHERAGRLDRAEGYWARIISDQRLPAKLIAWANQRLLEKERSEQADGETSDDATLRAQARLRAEQRRRAQVKLEEARKALQAQRYQDAMHLCLLARELDPDNAGAQQLLKEIEARRPDLGGVLGRLIEFVRTKELEEFEWLRAEVENIGRAARRGFDSKDWRTADRLYRMAIGLIDDSGFLTLGSTVDTGSLAEVRATHLHFLRETHDGGKQAGLSFEPEPPTPDLETRKRSGARALFGILADMFSPRAADAEALHFFLFAPELKRRGGKPLEPLVTSSFSPLKVEAAAGNLTRARWAERWIRRNIGARWMSTDELARRGVEDGKARARRRILIRVGDLICVQHGEKEHGRIEALHRAFGRSPTPMRVDMRLFAVDTAGAVRAAEALRARAGPTASGLDHVVSGLLLTESVRALEGLQGVQPLGQAQIRLDGTTSVMMELTQFTEEHPAYHKVPAPALTVEDRDARYGLWLDLFAEDMPGRAGPGNDRSAVSVVARVTQPHPLSASHVVPRTSRANPQWTRRPILVERRIEADREVPHYATFVLQGLPNPFPATNTTHGELLVLIGTTRQDTPTPDPPRASRDAPAIVPADLISREYRLGPLSTEVEDQVIPEDWPALRTATEGMSVALRRRLRDRNLGNILMSLAHIDAAALGAADAVMVQDHLVVGTMSSDDHIRLQQAVQRLRAHENDLYQVSVSTAAVPEGVWKQWMELEGMTANARGNWRATGAARETIEEALAKLFQRQGLFDTRHAAPARATQQVVHVPLRSQAITKDLRRHLTSHGRERFTPVHGVAEEGLVVEVRPNLEFEQDGVALRTVHVRARAARLKAIEKRRYPKAKLETALYDVPIWHPGSTRTHSEASDAEILGNDTLLVLPLIYPGERDRFIIVTVRVKKAQ